MGDSSDYSGIEITGSVSNRSPNMFTNIKDLIKIDKLNTSKYCLSKDMESQDNLDRSAQPELEEGYS